VKLWRRFGASWDRLGRDNAFGAILTKDGKIADWNAAEFWATGRDDVERFMTELSRLVPDAPRTRALDFGCGVGRITAALAEHYSDVVGVDVAESMIARARSLVTDPRCVFVLNRAPHLRQFKNASFAAVYCRLVLQHIEPSLIRRYIPDLVRILAPRGVLMFQLPEPMPVLHVDELGEFQRAPVVGSRWKQSLPRPVVSAWRWIKFQFVPKPPPPLMGRFGLQREEVLALVRTAGGVVLHMRADDSHGDAVPGFVYWVTRPA
jgi:SAM-dependent methyltransferase